MRHFPILLCGILLLTIGCKDNSVQLAGIEEQLQSLNQKLDLVDAHLTADDSTAANQGGGSVNNAELNRQLLRSDEGQLNDIIEQNLNKAKSFETVSLANVQKIVASLEALDTILNHPELTSEQSTLLAQAQTDLVAFLQKNIRKQAEQWDEDAMDQSDYGKAKSLWSDAATLLEFFPSTNDPIVERQFNDLMETHEQVASYIQQKQTQRYNQWACSQIKQASSEIAGQSPSAVVTACIKYMGPIDPTLLEPLSLELYTGLIETVRTQIPLRDFYNMAERVSTVQRKALDAIGSADIQE